MSEQRIGIATLYDREDERLKKKVEVNCMYVDRNGTRRQKTVKVTEAEKYIVEAIAMRLFLDRKKFVKREKFGDNMIRLSACLTVEKQ